MHLASFSALNDFLEKYFDHLQSIYPLGKLCGTFTPMSAERAKEVTKNSLKIFDFLFLTTRSTLENQKSCSTSTDTKKAVTALKDIRYVDVLKLDYKLNLDISYVDI